MNKHLSNEQILFKAEQAYSKNELKKFLSGNEEYFCPTDKYSPANIPTDIIRILKFGVYQLYEKNRDHNLIFDYKMAILSLAKGHAVDVWWAFSICWQQLYNEKRSQTNKSPFQIVDQNIINEIRIALEREKDSLKQSKEWQGWNLENGLWGDIEIQNKKSLDWFGVSFL